MDISDFHAALSVELDRWAELRGKGAAQLAEQADADMHAATRKALVNEYNAHVRRLDSLWRQFNDDHKRANAVATL